MKSGGNGCVGSILLIFNGVFWIVSKKGRVVIKKGGKNQADIHFNCTFTT